MCLCDDCDLCAAVCVSVCTCHVSLRRVTIPKSEVAVSRRPSTSTKTNKLAKLTTHEERDGPDPLAWVSLSQTKK